MDVNAVNLAIRFLLEISGIFTLALWGWPRSDGNIKFILALAIPIIAAAIWGIFAVPDDPIIVSYERVSWLLKQ